MRNLKKFMARLNKPVLQGSSYRSISATPPLVFEESYGLWNILKRSWVLRYGHIRLRLMDINCITYLGLIGILLNFFHRSVIHWPFFVFIHIALVIGILEIIRLGEKYPHNKMLWILRTFYPVGLFLFAWEELGVLVPMFYGSYWATDIIVRMDKLIFGVYPTIWFQQFYQPWLNELINFFYAFYYTFFLLVPLSLFVRKKREEAFAVLSIATFVYFSNFCFFYLLPAVSPPFIPTLQQLVINKQTGYVFVKINQIVQAQGGIPSGAFPSSHVAGALAWGLCTLRYNRKLGYALIPTAFGIAIATVYTGVHHGLDPIFGFIWGGISFAIALKLIKLRREDPLISPNNSSGNKS